MNTRFEGYRDVLPSWRDTKTRRAILDLVARITSEGGDDYVPAAERFAAFDNDGTLWCEQPMYIQVDFLIRRWRAMGVDPDLAATQPYRAALEQDMAYFANYREHIAEVAAAVGAAHAGITPEAFEHEVLRFFAEARHPRFARPYAEMIYRPMVELIGYLRAHDFTVLICTGAGRDFVRAVGEQFYATPREAVIGSSVQLRYQDGALIRQPELTLPIDDGPGKPVHLFNRIGRAPVLAVGNSDGDYEMLEYARYGILLHHDDAEREYAYDVGAEHALARAPQAGWNVVSMRDDWVTVF